jgi:hypothetical protein
MDRALHFQINHGWKTLSDLEEECRYRGLPCTGSERDLGKRLDKANNIARTPEGARIDNERRLKYHQKKGLDGIVPFPLFNKFPIDIRLLIWECECSPSLFFLVLEVSKGYEG